MSSSLAEILSRGRPPFVVVDFPRLDSDGKPIARVHLRLLTIAEEQTALAQARKNCSQSAREWGDYKSDLNDYEHNERMVEILRLACREVDDPDRLMFPSPGDIRLFTSDEIGILVAHYARLKDGTPRVAELSEREFEQLVGAFASELDAHPFSSWPRAELEAYSERCTRSLVAGPLASTTTTNGSSDSP